jgi:hypothetical protein
MDQGLICMNPDPSTAPPIVVAYPDGPDIGLSSVATSNTLNLGMNLNNPLGLITFFLQEDTVDPMAIDEEQTATTAPLGDDPTAFNSTEATWLLKLLCRHHIAISSVEEAAAESRHYKYRLCIEPPLHALAAATHPMMIVMYQAATAALPWGKPAASETAATTMVAPTSSATMIALTGVTALSCHITAAGCGTNFVRCSTPPHRCRRLRPPQWGRGAAPTHAKAATSSSSCYSTAVPMTPSPSLVAHSLSVLGSTLSPHGLAPPTSSPRLSTRCTTSPRWSPSRAKSTIELAVVMPSRRCPSQRSPAPSPRTTI